MEFCLYIIHVALGLPEMDISSVSGWVCMKNGLVIAIVICKRCAV